MRAIVFGGCGFLGSHVADTLTLSGYDVKIFDLKYSPYLRGNQEMIVGDILEVEQVKKAVIGCDYVYNFAGIADLDDATTKPLDTVQLNVLGNLNILDASLKAGVKRFVFASSIYVYSEKGGFYRCSKQASEIYIEEYQRRWGLDYTILRYGTLYGQRAKENNSVRKYLKQALEKGHMVCDGSGEEMREYINVRDAARLSVEVLKEQYRNQHIIITGHHPMKFKDMIYMIKEILQKDIKIDFTKECNSNHYNLTPYSFIPKIGNKLVSHCYIDMGQGMLECLHDILEEKSK
jgi:UDP-glucose 4-epimerase